MSTMTPPRALACALGLLSLRAEAPREGNGSTTRGRRARSDAGSVRARACEVTIPRADPRPSLPPDSNREFRALSNVSNATAAAWLDHLVARPRETATATAARSENFRVRPRFGRERSGAACYFSRRRRATSARRSRGRRTRHGFKSRRAVRRGVPPRREIPRADRARDVASAGGGIPEK